MVTNHFWSLKSSTSFHSNFLQITQKKCFLRILDRTSQIASKIGSNINLKSSTPILKLTTYLFRKIFWFLIKLAFSKGMKIKCEESSRNKGHIDTIVSGVLDPVFKKCYIGFTLIYGASKIIPQQEIYSTWSRTIQVIKQGVSFYNLQNKFFF